MDIRIDTNHLRTKSSKTLDTSKLAETPHLQVPHVYIAYVVRLAVCNPNWLLIDEGFIGGGPLTKLAYCPKEPKAIPFPPRHVMLRTVKSVEFCNAHPQRSISICSPIGRGSLLTPLMARQSSPHVMSQFRSETLVLRYVLIPITTSDPHAPVFILTRTICIWDDAIPTPTRY